MLHIFNEESNMSQNSIERPVRFARSSQHKNHGLYYDFLFYFISEGRAKKQTAEGIVSSWGFRTRLWMLMEDAEIL